MMSRALKIELTGGNMSRRSKTMAELIWDLTEGQIRNFVRLSKKCEVPDEKIEECLAQMIVTAFKEVEEEEKANDGEPTEQA